MRLVIRKSRLADNLPVTSSSGAATVI